MASDELAGALIGGGVGAIAGHAIGGNQGAAVGGFLGAMVGIAVADSRDDKDRRHVHRPHAYPVQVAHPGHYRYAPPPVRHPHAAPPAWGWHHQAQHRDHGKDRDGRHDHGWGRDDRDDRRGHWNVNDSRWERDRDRDRDRNGWNHQGRDRDGRDGRSHEGRGDGGRDGDRGQRGGDSRDYRRG
jgi:hypothetical protein